MIHDVAAEIRSQIHGDGDTSRTRMGVVQAVNSDGTVDVTIGGESSVVPGVSALDSYASLPGDTVWISVSGPDMFVLGRTATEQTDTGWIEMTGWLNGSSPYLTGGVTGYIPRMRRMNGVVYLEGLFNSGSTANGQHVFTLPAGFRPSSTTMLALPHTGTGIRRCDVASSGTMILREQFAGSPTTGWHDLHTCFPQDN